MGSLLRVNSCIRKVDKIDDQWNAVIKNIIIFAMKLMVQESKISNFDKVQDFILLNK